MTAAPHIARFLVLWNAPTDPAAFDEHYWNVHIPLAHRMPRLRSYTVSRNVSVVRGEDAFYIVGELEWSNMDDLRADFQTLEGRATAEDVDVLSQWSPGVRSVVFEVLPTE